MTPCPSFHQNSSLSCPFVFLFLLSSFVLGKGLWQKPKHSCWSKGGSQTKNYCTPTISIGETDRERHRDRETDRDRKTERERETDRERHRERDTDRDTDTDTHAHF